MLISCKHNNHLFTQLSINLTTFFHKICKKKGFYEIFEQIHRKKTAIYSFCCNRVRKATHLTINKAEILTT